MSVNIHEKLQTAIQTLLGRGLTIEEARLLLEASDVLTAKFITIINEPLYAQRLVLMFDSFEYSTSGINAWIQSKLLPLFIPNKAVVIIAGRNKLKGREWYRSDFALQQIELRPFNLREARMAVTFSRRAFYPASRAFTAVMICACP